MPPSPNRDGRKISKLRTALASSPLPTWLHLLIRIRSIRMPSTRTFIASGSCSALTQPEKRKPPIQRTAPGPSVGAADDDGCSSVIGGPTAAPMLASRAVTTTAPLFIRRELSETEKP